VKGPSIAVAVVAALVLAGCGQKRNDSAEEAPVAALGTGIPVGAPGAVGVDFASPAARPNLPDPDDLEALPKPLPMPLPPDPFEAPDDEDLQDDGGPAPAPPSPKRKKGMAL